MDNLKTMKAFIKVAETGSFAAAARELKVSTSTLSRLVVELESWLAMPLIRRTTRSLTLTDAGHRYLDRGRHIISEWEQLATEAQASAEAPRGALHVAGASYPMRMKIAPLLPDFLEAHPDLQVHLHLEEEQVDLVSEGIDIAIRIGELADSSLVVRKCGEVRLKLTAAPDFIDKHGRPTSLNDVPSFPCLVDMTRRYGNRWPIGGRVSIEPALSANDGGIIRELTLAGLGMSLLPDFFVDQDIASGHLVELFPDESIDKMDVFTLLPARRQIIPGARAFADFLFEKLSPRHRSKGA